MQQSPRILIVGGVAGGASCATRLRRLDENATIILFEKGPHISFANCGLPYHVGNIIPHESDLLLANPQLFLDRFQIDARTRHEVTAIHPDSQTIEVRNLDTGTLSTEPFDYLVLSPGAQPIRPPLPGIDLPGIFTLRSIPDAQAIRAHIEDRNARKAVVVGGGFIGLEMAENLLHRGLDVTLLEKLPQVMPPLDPEMVEPVHQTLRSHGVHLHLGDGVSAFHPQPDGSLTVETESGQHHPTDLVILAIGVRPDTRLAAAAGLTLGPRGGIQVDPQMRTSHPRIFAVGDAVEVQDTVTHQPTLLALAGPANRQGRVAADAICGRPSLFRGVQGTSVVGLLGLTLASTGTSEKHLLRAGIQDFHKIYLHPNHHSAYYPGAARITLKLLFRTNDGRILGAQAVGTEGVEKRIDVIAMAIQKEGTVFDLEEAELCYAPQFGGAKDPVNYAGMIAANTLRGDLPLTPWEQLGTRPLIDVRNPDEFATGSIPGARNIPLPQLRGRLDEIPQDQPVDLFCGVGQRGYYAARILRQHGRDARNLSGGFLTHRMRSPA